MDETIVRAAPEPKRPLDAQESWACVHVDREFVWVDPSVSGESWRGHVMMFELPPDGLRRRQRQALTDAIAELTASLPNLTRVARDRTVRLAAGELASMRF